MEKLHNMKKLTALDVYETGRIYWVGSYRAVLLYMKKYESILKPITNGKTNRGKRYYVAEENVDELVRKFEDGLLM